MSDRTAAPAAPPDEEEAAPTATGATAAAGADGAAPAAPPARARGRRVLVVGGLVVVLAVPLVVALVALHSPRWYPLLDLAQTELRVRDVGGRHTPLVGLAGRIDAYGQQGSHPGPISFWALAPVYTLFGRTAFALQVASVALHLAAMAAILAVAQRRGGARWALAFAAVLAVLTHLYGTRTLTEAWNPFMPVLWWFLFLLAVWSVLDDDIVLLPVAVFAGSFCAQTHVPYVGLVAAVLGLTVAVVVVRAARGDDAGFRWRLLRWGAGSAALGVLLWVPPLIDQAINDPGNMSMIVESFRDTPEPPVGLRTGAELLGVHLDVSRLLAGDVVGGDFATGDPTARASWVAGVALFVVWAAAVAVAWRLRHRSLLRLHGLLAAVLALAVVSLSRIFGELWYYLVMWAWGVTALLVASIVWTACAALAARARRPGSAIDLTRVARAGTAALVALLVGFTALFAADATRAEAPIARQSRLLAGVVPDTVEALDADVAGAGGRDGRYLVTWTDPVAIGSTGFGLLLELERAGFDVGVPAPYRTGAVPHRVREPDEITAEVHLSIGDDIATWRDRPDAIEVAAVDLRTEAEVERYRELRAEALAGLTRAGLDERASEVDGALLVLAIDSSVPEDVREIVREMAGIGVPAAVFVTPV